MKIIINRKAFADALNTCVGFIANKNVLEVFNNIKFVTKGNNIRLQAGNAERHVKKYVSADSIDQDGSFMTDGKQLANFVSKLTCDSVELTIDADILTLRHPAGKAEFSVRDAAEYPEDTIGDETPAKYVIPTSFIVEAISKGKDFVSTDDLRPAMQAVYCYIKDGSFGFAATDTRVLAHGERPFADNAPADDMDFFIMPDVSVLILKNCRGAEDAEISLYDKRVAYRFGDTIIVASKFKGQYPDFRRLLTMMGSHTCTFDKKNVLTAIDRVSLLTDNNQMVKFAISPMDMELSAQNIERQSKGSEQVSCAADINLTAYFNSVYFIRCLNLFNDGDVSMIVTDANRPAYFRSEKNPGIIALQMPMAGVSAQ